MADHEPNRYKHFLLRGVTEAEPFRHPGGGGGGAGVPRRDRPTHARGLLTQIERLKTEAARARADQVAAGFEDGLGIQVEFESFPDIELAFESLAAERSGIELLNVRHDATRTHATVFVPDGKMELFERKIQAYLEERKDSRGQPRDNQRLVDAIRGIRSATLQALWTDDPALLPSDERTAIWWEVWLPVKGDRDAVIEAFRGRATGHGMRVLEGDVQFPERTVLIVHATPAQMKRSLVVLNNIAELRRAKETAEFFDSLPLDEQQEWIADLLARARFQDAGGDVPHVCILDTGTSRAHPLLAPALATSDMHSVEPAWGVDDGDGHGTGLAGIALGGDLTRLLEAGGSIEVGHRLESVKVLLGDGGNAGDAQFHAYLTEEGVARPEVTAPARRRIFAMALTARDARDRGRPSAWSAAIDRLASDAMNQGESPRLLIIAAGNVEDPAAWREYPASNDSDGIHDPAQAWNALTVGACTDLVRITEPDAGELDPVARAGGLSPFSTTSLVWQDTHWPLKPDLVLEGGNAAKDGLGAVWLPSLSLLTAHHRPTERLFTTTNATSAATALVARMAAQVMVEYPTIWAETVRGLLVHSAEWTDEMRRQYLSPAPTKRHYQQLVQRCGFGVPNLDRALWSLGNSLTMVVEEQISPFIREGSGEPTLRDMHLHRLPWPLDALEALQATEVELRVTLSYFIEPNPSARGVASRYRYESHGLRFDVKRPEESVSAFRARVNAAARADDDAGGGRRGTSADPHWLLGPKVRHRGSLHSDVWRGTGAALASRGFLAVYPTAGWWKTRPRLECHDRAARYSLLVSIRAPEVDVDLRAEVATRIDLATEIDT